MRIAILGWGSLLWEKRPEFDKWHKRWGYDGPTLPLEFSRISGKTRHDALTLVIDLENGVPCTVAWSLSKRSDLKDAVSDLRKREDTTVSNIGRLLPSNSVQQDHSKMAIFLWAQEKKLDAVIWTALKSNFKKKCGKPFSIEAAIQYLLSLPPKGRIMAEEYFQRAPEFVKTRLSHALQKEQSFWRSP